MDYAEHEKTFSLFGGLIKWGTVFCVIFTLL
ncbi:MAG: aa3-type cytochrome c oxidase subunit IV, partial [Rhabdaerophilum sp.]